jgi:hypothetical protein
MRVHFLGLEIHNNTRICDSLPLGDAGYFVVSHDKNEFSPLLSCLVIALCYAAKILVECRLPRFSCGGVFHQPFVTADSLTCDWMHHWHCHLFKIQACWCCSWRQLLWCEDVGRFGPHAFGNKINSLLTDNIGIAHSSCDRSKTDSGDAHR